MLGVLALAGCASMQGPVAPPQIAVPANWQAGQAVPDATALSAWWRRFGDPDLPPLVAQALAGNASVEAAQARLRQARAQRALSGAGLMPTLGSNASAQASHSEGRATSESYRMTLEAGFEPDPWGATAAGVRATDAAARASAATLAGTRVAVAAEVAIDLLQWRGTQARLAIAHDNLASQQQTLQITEWREQAGLVTPLDVAQARTAVAQTAAQIPALQASAGQSLNALAVLIGRPPGSLQAQLSASSVQPRAPADLALAFPAEVLRQRPDVYAAEQQLLAADARVAQADAQRLPSLSLGGSIGLNALSLGGLGSGAGVASLAASVSLPLLDGGRLRTQVRLQEAARDEAQAAYRSTVLSALQQVEDTLLSLRGAREQLARQQEAAAAARAAATLAAQRYASGLVDFQNVLQTQRSLLSAEDGAAATLTALNVQHVRLYQSLGGGWTPEQTESPTP